MFAMFISATRAYDITLRQFAMQTMSAAPLQAREHYISSHFWQVGRFHLLIQGLWHGTYPGRLQHGHYPQ